jgi:hypothetical protein
MSNTLLEVQRQIEISEYLKAKATLKELLSYSNSNRDFEIKMLSDKVARFESRLDFAKIQMELEAKHTELFKAKCDAPKPKRFHYDPQGHYYEIWIDGELFLECTSCSADGPGNCGCWSID